MTAASQSEAKRLGELRYFTGKPCPKGHVEERLTSSGQCLACCRQRMASKYASNPDAYRKKSADYRANNPEKSRAAIKAYDERNREKRRLDAAKRRAINPDLHRAAVAKYHEQNGAKIKARKNEIERIKKATNPTYKAERNIRRSLAYRLQKYGYKKSASSMEILGCSWSEFVRHIESLFKPGMSWDNRIEWHIDHITPLASAKTYEEMIALWHHTNLQPLWAQENMRKGRRVGISQC
jgi:hypothetical protein